MSYLGTLLKQQVADEDFRIAKAVAKNEAKLAQEEYEKYMRAQKELKEINDYRLHTVSYLDLFSSTARPVGNLTRENFVLFLDKAQRAGSGQTREGR